MINNCAGVLWAGFFLFLWSGKAPLVPLHLQRLHSIRKRIVEVPLTLPHSPLSPTLKQ